VRRKERLRGRVWIAASRRRWLGLGGSETVGCGGADEGDCGVALREELGYDVLAGSSSGTEEEEVHV
jgi:hypothetical protein